MTELLLKLLANIILWSILIYDYLEQKRLADEENHEV